MKLQRIFIIGIYGTGKSTFAKMIQEKTKLPSYELDSIKYKRKFDIIRPLAERLQKIKQIANQKKWIVEGPLTSHAIPLYKKAERIYLLKPSLLRTLYQIAKRHGERKKMNLKEHTIQTTLKMMGHAVNYYRNKQDSLTFKRHVWYAQRHGKGVIILQNNKEMQEEVRNLI